MHVKYGDHRVAQTRLRVSSNWLSVITRAWSHEPWEHSLSHLCKSVGDEFHFLFSVINFKICLHVTLELTFVAMFQF